MFRSLLVDNILRYTFNPLLGALGGLVGWALFAVCLAVLDGIGVSSDLIERVSYFAFLGLSVAFATNMLRGIQDGLGPMRVFGQAMVSGIVGGIGGLLSGLLIHLLAEMAGTTMDGAGPRIATYVLVGTLVGLSARITTLDRTTGLAAVGGLLGGLFASGIWLLLDSSGSGAAAYATLLIPMVLGFGIGAATYSLPSFVSGGSLQVMTGQFRGQSKEIEGKDIIVGNNKRQLQWVLPKWEGVQDPHARIEVQAQGQGWKHRLHNLSAKTLVVVRDGKRTKLRKGKDGFELSDGDVLVFATGSNRVKVKYAQRTNRD